MGWFGAALAGLVVLWLVISSRGKLRFFSRDHLVEVAAGLRSMQGEVGALLRRRDAGIDVEGQPPPGIRTKSLVLGWSARHEDGGVMHHLSQSSREVAWAANGTLLAYAFERLGLPWEEADVYQTQSGVIHARVLVTDEAHAELIARPIEDPPVEGFRKYLGTIMDLRERRGPPRRVTMDGSPPQRAG